MIRLALWIAASLLVAALAAWLISLPGTLTLEVGGLRMQPQLGTAIFILILAALLVIAVWAIVRRLIGAPSAMSRRSRERRREQGVAALSDAVVALQAGLVIERVALAGRARHVELHDPLRFGGMM